jgi:hypothetical protein
MATTTQVNEIYRYTVGLFKAAPGAYFANLEDFVDAGYSTGDLALMMANTSVFTSLYPAASSDAMFVSAFVNNLVGSSVAAGDKAWAQSYLEGLLADGATRAQVAVDAIDAISSVPADNEYWGGARELLDARMATAQLLNPPLESDIASLQAVIAQSGVTFNIDAFASDDSADGIMHLTGDQDVRIDFTHALNQVTGLDLNGDTVIRHDGIENNDPTTLDDATSFNIVDAYARNPINHYDNANNFLGDILFDGTGFDGDGVSTDGNIFLGGLGADNATGGIGNDFMAGGGVAEQNDGEDYLFGGRNADFFFANLSAIDMAEGDALDIDGGETADDSYAGMGDSAQDTDWLLLEASDDDEPVVVRLAEKDITGTITTAFMEDRGGNIDTGDANDAIDITNLENVDASGNLYGFLDGIDVAMGEAGTVTADGENVGIGSSAQLQIYGNSAINRLIGGFDNDYIEGGAGDDLLMGGNLAYNNNPNLENIVNNGMDTLLGGADDDNIVFEADGGIIDGGTDLDTLWLTDQALGTKTAADMLEDGIDGELRFDLAAQNIDASAGYGGADVDGTQDQTNYSSADSRVTVTNMENVIATGLGDIDFLAAGTNAPDDDDAFVFTNQQNFFAYEGNLDLRGTSGVEVYDDVYTYATIEYSIGSAAYPRIALEEFTYTIPGETSAADAVATFLELYPSDNVNVLSSDIVTPKQEQSSYTVGGENILYASSGNDVIEGRGGNDLLSGGTGTDDFIFALDGDDSGDDINVIHRQTDIGENLTDGTFERDFGVGDNSATTYSPLRVNFFNDHVTGTELTDLLTSVDALTFGLEGVDFAPDDASTTLLTVTLDDSASYDTWAAVAEAFNAKLQDMALDVDITVSVSDTEESTLLITNDQNIQFVSGTELGAGVQVTQRADTETGNQFNALDPETANFMDRIIFASYEDRADGERVDDDSFIGSTIALGSDAYAQDLVVGFDQDGDTILAEDQAFDLKFDNLTTEDIVTITVNEVTYQLQVGVDLDGNFLETEDIDCGTYSQAEIQNNFLTRMQNFIDSFMDDDTAAGSIDAALIAPDTLRLTQNVYHSEETVFFVVAVDVDGTGSGTSTGEKATVEITNRTQTEVDLYQFDGRDGELNLDNVRFEGNTEENRSVLQTADDQDGGLLLGQDAVLVDNLADSLTDNLNATFADDEVLANDRDALTGDTTTKIDVDIVNNQAINENLSRTGDDLYTEAFSVHGDDQLFGGDAKDMILAGTGDDRVYGSLGADSIDGGKDYYAVQVLGEAQARVFILNDWEAANVDQVLQGDGMPLEDLVITSTTLIDQVEDCDGNVNGAFDDTLIFQQADFVAGETQFTITLDNYDVTVAGVVELQNDGAGHVAVDVEGDGDFESTTAFTNFENVRTVSGISNAVADDGQGNDTLNVAALSTDTGGISYDLTNEAGRGEVNYSQNSAINALAYEAGQDASALAGATVATVKAAILATPAANVFYAEVNAVAITATSTVASFLSDVAALPTLSRPTSVSDAALFDTDYESTIISIDGVENVQSGDGNDLLLIDETEAAKHNSFDAGLGVDRIEYLNDYVDNAADGSAQPTVTIEVGAQDSNVDVVSMTTGRVGSTVANDTLTSVEYVTLNGETAQGDAETDTIDVTALTAGAVVDYTNGEVLNLTGEVQVTIEGIVDMEIVEADGNDTVIVADSAKMGANATSDATDGSADDNIAFLTYLDFDEFNATSSARIAFNDQTNLQISDVVNQGQFVFDLSHTGDGEDTDTVDYSNESARIAAVLNFTEDDDSHYVLVSGDEDDDYTDAGARIDHLISVEQIVASAGTSIIDLTSSTTDTNIQFSFEQPDALLDYVEGQHKIEAIDRQINTVRITDADSLSSIGNVNLIEYRDLGEDDAVNQVTATWNNIEGSDNDEYVEFTQWEDGINHTLNLRGGDNEVNYNERTNGIILQINAVDDSDHRYDLTVVQLDSAGNELTFADNITGYNGENLAAQGTMRIEASQGDLDLIDVNGVNASGIFLVGNIEPSGSSVVTATFDGEGTGLVMSGFEYLWDGVLDDTYVIEDLGDFVNKLVLIDWANKTGTAPTVVENPVDRDVVALTNGSFETAVIKAPISHTITVSNDLHMGDADADDLQWIGVNNLEVREALGVNGSVGFDFKVLDVQNVTNQIDLTATASGLTLGDEIVVGDLAYFNDAAADAGTAGIFAFDVLSLTNNTNGTTFELNTVDKELQDATNARIVAFDGATLDASRIDDRDLNLSATANGTLIGGAGDDVITGGTGVNIITGGLGADVLDGNFTPAEARVITVEFTGGLVGDGANDATVTVGGLTLTEGTEITEGAGQTQIAADIATALTADLDLVADLSGLATKGVESVTSDGGVVTFTFAPGIDTDVIGISFNLNADTGTMLMSGESVDVIGADVVDTSDTFVYTAAAESTEANMDQILNFTIDGSASANDVIDITAITLAMPDPGTVGGDMYDAFNWANSVQTTYDVLAAMASADLLAASTDPAQTGVIGYAGSIGTAAEGDSFLFLDADRDGVYDSVVELTGVAHNDFIGGGFDDDNINW